MQLDSIHNTLSETILNAVDMSVAQPSAPVTIQGITNYAIQCSWTGFTGNGAETITTSGSNDGVIWTPVDSFIPTGTTGSRLLNVEKAGYRFVRLFYVPGSTVGVLTATISGKII